MGHLRCSDGQGHAPCAGARLGPPAPSCPVRGRVRVPASIDLLPDYIAANQEGHADIREFKEKHDLHNVIVFWTTNTERYSDIIPGVNDTAENLLASIKSSHSEVSPSTIFAVALILEGVPFINGGLQNMFVSGVIDLAKQRKSFIGGDDLKSGQTKSVLTEFLVNAGIKPLYHVLQPPWEQRWLQLVRGGTVQDQGDRQEQCCR